MSLDLRLPLVGAFDVPAVWGNPWHGYVQGDVLTLPNATARSHPQPSGAYHWEYTAAHLLQVPGVPPVSRGTAEAAADAGAGRDWRTYALLSGSTGRLYGKALGRGRFVYVDPAGDRWLIDASALDLKVWSPSTVPASVQIPVRRFGVVGLTSAPTTYTVSVPDLGQAGTPIYSDSNTETGFFDSSLYSLHPQGGAAIFMLHYQCTAAWPANRFPCGWYELRISGPGSNPTLSIHLLHGRLETLGGSGSVSESVSPGLRYSLYSKTTFDQTGPSAAPACVGDRTVTINAALWHEPYLPEEDYVERWQPSTGQRGVGFGADYSVSIAQSYAGMVLAVWYDKAGNRQALTLDMAYSFEALGTGSGGGSSASAVTEYSFVAVGGGCEAVIETDTPYSLTLSRTDSAAESIMFTVRRNGISIGQQNASYVGSASESVTFTGSFATPEQWTYTGSSNHALTGSVVAGMSSPGATINSNSTSDSAISPDYVAANVGSTMHPDAAVPGKRALWLRALAQNVHWADPFTLISAWPARLGQGAVGWVRRVAVDGAAVTFSLFGEIYIAEGVASAPSWSSAGSALPTTPLYVAVQPMTGAVRAAEQPVCWV